MKKLPFLACLFALACTLTAAVGGFDAKFGRGLVRANGHTVTTSTTLRHAPLVAVYFSAHWCPPCRKFTPQLVKFYQEANRDEKTIEIVFVSADESKSDMLKYMKSAKMPWFGVPFDSPVRERLMKDYKVTGIPTLVVLDQQGRVISADARREVMQDGQAALKRWLSNTTR